MYKVYLILAFPFYPLTFVAVYKVCKNPFYNSGGVFLQDGEQTTCPLRTVSVCLEILGFSSLRKYFLTIVFKERLEERQERLFME